MLPTLKTNLLTESQWKHFKLFTCTCLWYFKIKSRTRFSSGNAMINSKLILNLVNPGKEWVTTRLESEEGGWVCEGNWGSHYIYVPFWDAKRNTCPESGQELLSILLSVKGLPLWKGSNQRLIIYGLIQLVYLWWSLCWGWLKNIMLVQLRSRNAIVTFVFKVWVVAGIRQCLFLIWWSLIEVRCTMGFNFNGASLMV